MREKMELKIFRKASIEYLKKMYNESVELFFDKDLWVSRDPETFGKSRVLLKTRRSLKRIGSELNIFRLPTVEGMRIVYDRSKTYVNFFFRADRKLAVVNGSDFLLRDDLNESADYLNESELKIFRLPTIDKLEVLYRHKKGL